MYEIANSDTDEKRKKSIKITKSRYNDLYYKRTYSKDLRKFTDEQKLERGAKAAGVTLEEWTALSPADRTLLRTAAKKENAYSRGFTKAAWKRLPMSEKFAILRGAR